MAGSVKNALTSIRLLAGSDFLKIRRKRFNGGKERRGRYVV
jgi:hypothetical protein